MSLRSTRRPVSPGVVLATLLSVASPGLAAGADRVEFNRDIRPILSENCFFCHGPDKNTREADLRLDLRDEAVKLGAIAPGKVDESELVARVVSDDPGEVMPPPKSTKKLTAAQKATLTRWVEQGAEYQAHWAYVPPRKVEAPAVSRQDWVRNPIDAFILKGLDAKKLKPSPEADRRTLIRRLSLDLLGLPPTPEQVDVFLADGRPDAYERLVDALLASPRYGERMAVPWLDLVRFSDSVGYHGDQSQNIFPYRDYVIDAFNQNKPFDRFTAEQLAGDLLPDATEASRVATGFNRLNMMTREGGAQPKEYLAKYAGDRVRTVSITWLGSTMGCAECHDHKYDPFTAKDFYSLAAFFADVRQWGVYSDYGYTPNPDLRGYTNDHPFPPEIEVESPYLRRRIERLRDSIDEVVATASAPGGSGQPGVGTDGGAGRPQGSPLRGRSNDPVGAPLVGARDEGKGVDAWVGSTRAFLARNPGGWETPRPEVDGDDLEVREDASVLITAKVAKPAANAKAKPAARKKGPADEARIAMKPSPGPLAAIRVEVLPDPTHGGKVTRNGADSATVNVSAALKVGGKESALPFSAADADRKDPRYAGGSPLLGVLAGWKTAREFKGESQTAVYVLASPTTVPEGAELVVSVKSDGVGRVRVSTSPIVPEDPRQSRLDPTLVEALGVSHGERSASQARAIQAAYLVGTGWDREALAKVQALRAEILACRDGRAATMVTEAWTPTVTRVLPRGNWQDETGAVVTPAVPAFLPQPPDAKGRRLNRLDLARWITSPENPLTARVFANRTWKQFFGTGISGVMEDVGGQGEWPVHPELLDWLAVDFRESGWDIKRLVRTIVTSAAYRQDARLRPELKDSDPNNRLVASQTPRRLEAEFVRDNALSVAGLLNLDLGGPSARPYQPSGYYANLQFPDRVYAADRDERQYRRGVYAHWQRTFLQPMLANFDAPSREECTASRPLANTPQQALTLLNDPTFVEAARVLAARAISAEPKGDEARLRWIYRRALARPAKAKELASLSTFLDAQRGEYRAKSSEADKLLHVGIAPAPAPDADEPELAAWTAVCRVVLNLHESITRY